MPLTGELEHLPIVDVIQLINSTRKSGTLYVYSRKGEGQLVFDKGYIVGASHSNEKFRIGQILLDASLISQADLDKALSIQKSSVADRQPLISTLLEHCGMSREAAFKALETLIEMTVVEMISWTRGIFSLDVDTINITDNYRYLPAQLQQVTFDSQMVLMDALRIYDEKVHAGEITIVNEPLDAPPPQLEEPAEARNEDSTEEVLLSEEILGLADLDKIERKKPRIFKSLEAFDPTEIHRQIVKNALPELDQDSQEQLVMYLSELSSPGFADEVTLKAATQSQAIIMYASDEFIQHAVMTVCKREGSMVFTTSDKQDLGILIERALDKQLNPILVFDNPGDSESDFNKESLISCRQQIMADYPQASVIQLASPLEYSFSLQSLNAGIRTIFPRPLLTERQTSYSQDIIEFLKSFQTYIQSCFNEERQQQFAKLRNSLAELKKLSKAPDISLSVLSYVGEIFERSLTLIVDKNDLIAERSIGIQTDKSSGPSTPLKFRVPLTAASVFESVIRSGTTYFGSIKDGLLNEVLFPEIGAPLESKGLILPLLSNGRVITMTYADFGNQPAKQVPIEYVDFYANQAGLTIENALYRKQLDKAPRLN